MLYIKVDLLYLSEIGSYVFCGSIRTDGWPYHQDTIEGSFAKTCTNDFGFVRLSLLYHLKKRLSLLPFAKAILTVLSADTFQIY